MVWKSLSGVPGAPTVPQFRGRGGEATPTVLTVRASKKVPPGWRALSSLVEFEPLASQLGDADCHWWSRLSRSSVEQPFFGGARSGYVHEFQTLKFAQASGAGAGGEFGLPPRSSVSESP